MGRKKQIKLNEVRTFKNVFDSNNDNAKDKIAEYFGKQTSITLELGCGQADYSIGLAKLYPKKNFLGVDRKPNRLWNASKNADLAETKNVAVLISYVEKLGEIFDEMKVEEIWITFPDPYPFRRSMKKRLTHPNFIEIYKKILRTGGKINLKTDDDSLYNYTLQVIRELDLKLIKSTNDLYSSDKLTEEEKIQTKYEKVHLGEGKKIKFISFSF